MDTVQAVVKWLRESDKQIPGKELATMDMPAQLQVVTSCFTGKGAARLVCKQDRSIGMPGIVSGLLRVGVMAGDVLVS